MPTKEELETRTNSIKNIKQIVGTMELIARNRLRKVKNKALDGRPYSEKIEEVLVSISKRAKEVYHPLLEKKEDIKDICVICFTSDRGLCGGFNNTIIGKIEKFIYSMPDVRTKLIVIGRKGIYYFKRKNYDIIDVYKNLESNQELSIADNIKNRVMNLYENQQVDEVYLIFNKFKQQLIGEVNINKLLPLQIPKERGEKKLTEHLYEPSAYQVLNELIPQYIKNQIYQGALESRAQEEMARMLAMKQATDSADDMLEELTLQYNKLRQATITREIIEVVSGAQI